MKNTVSAPETLSPPLPHDVFSDIAKKAIYFAKLKHDMDFLYEVLATPCPRTKHYWHSFDLIILDPVYAIPPLSNGINWSNSARYSQRP